MSSLHIEFVENSRLALKKVKALVDQESLQDNGETQTALIDAHLQLESVISLLKSTPDIHTSDNELNALLDARDNLGDIWEASIATHIIPQADFESSLKALLSFLYQFTQDCRQCERFADERYGLDGKDHPTKVTIENLPVLLLALQGKVEAVVDKFQLGWREHKDFFARLETEFINLMNSIQSTTQDYKHLISDVEKVQATMPHLSRAIDIRFAESDLDFKNAVKETIASLIVSINSTKPLEHLKANMKEANLARERSAIEAFSVNRQIIYELVELNLRCNTSLTKEKLSPQDRVKLTERRVELFEYIKETLKKVGIADLSLSLFEYCAEWRRLEKENNVKALKTLEPYVKGVPLRGVFVDQAIPVVLGKYSEMWFPVIVLNGSDTSTEAPVGESVGSEQCAKIGPRIIKFVRKFFGGISIAIGVFFGIIFISGVVTGEDIMTVMLTAVFAIGFLMAGLKLGQFKVKRLDLMKNSIRRAAV